MDNQLTFGKKLKMLRVGKGLTQEEMANKLGISRRAYIPYEQDKARPRNEATYQQMAKILGCDVNELRDTASPSDKQIDILNGAIGAALAAVGLLVPAVGIASIPFIASSASSLTTAALSRSEKKKNQTNDSPEYTIDMINLCIEKQKSFQKTAKGIIYDDLADRRYQFSPISLDDLEEYGGKPDGCIQVFNSEIQSWWFSYRAKDPEFDKLLRSSQEDTASAMIRRYTTAAFDPHRKVSLVVNDEELYDALVAFRNHNCYRGLMSAILVNIDSSSIVKEETIADLGNTTTPLLPESNIMPHTEM